MDEEARLRDAVTSALRELFEYQGAISDGEYMGDWTCTVHIASLSGEHAYAQANSSDTMAPHTQIGLTMHSLSAMLLGEDEDDE